MPTAVPTAPSTLVATPASSTRINLTWADNSSDETSFIIERSANGTTGWGEIANSPTAANAVSAFDDSLTPNTIYYYRVRAANSGGSSVESSVSHATTLPAMPADLRAKTLGDGKIKLWWQPTAGTGYIVERSADGSTGWTQIQSSGATVCFESGLPFHANFWYRIAATGADGNSDYSSIGPVFSGYQGCAEQ